MDIKNTKDYPEVASMVMMVYGMGGVGKTTFASTFPKPLLLDFENGAKYFGDRGIEIDVAVFQSWLTQEDKKELKEKLDDYETIVIDPIGEAMDKLINDEDTVSGSKYRQSNGDLTMAGWGEVKKQMRNFIKWLRDTGKNVVLVAHVDEGKDGETLVKRPLIPTKLSDEIVTMVDVVGYMKIVQSEGEPKRVIMVDSTDERVISKDRTGKLGKYLKPDYKYITEQLKTTTQGSLDEKTSTLDSVNAAVAKALKGQGVNTIKDILEVDETFLATAEGIGEATATKIRKEAEDYNDYHQSR